MPTERVSGRDAGITAEESAPTLPRTVNVNEAGNERRASGGRAESTGGGAGRPWHPALRSRVIAGLLGGVLVWAIVDPRPDVMYPEEWFGQLFLWGVIGFFAGIWWDVLHSLKPPPDVPGA
ncbi:MAG TPA: hypothetical protein VFG04_20530 [Planctomycetaceae bacterium]|jgi:hypothetical protein|nr:hypothetical protein [Planctomycetaceae bacterium]